MAGHDELPDNVVPLRPRRAGRRRERLPPGAGGSQSSSSNGEQVWVARRTLADQAQAQEAERRHRDACWPASPTRPARVRRALAGGVAAAGGATRTQLRGCGGRFSEHFGPTPLGEVERLSARTWALSVPRGVSRVIATCTRTPGTSAWSRQPVLEPAAPGYREDPGVTAPSLEEYRRLLAACTVLGGYGAEFRALIQFAAGPGFARASFQALQLGRRRRGHDHGSSARASGRIVASRRTATYARSRSCRPPGCSTRCRGDADAHSSSTRRGAGHSTRATTASPGVGDVRRGPTVRWHDLRHFCATQLLEMGLDHFAVSVQLGHEDGGALVMARYGHPSVDAAKRRLLGAFEFDAAETGSAAGSSG